MKQRIILTTTAALLCAGILFNGCKKDDTDTTAPVVTLNGSNPMNISLNAPATDPGATASDETDGTVYVSSTWSSSNPDVNKAGTYTVTYTATDAAGNTGSATRTVIVKNDASFLEGSYGVTENPGGTVWIQTITASTTKNNVLMFSKFANYSGNTGITAKLTGTTTQYVILDPSPQTATAIGSPPCDDKFTHNGNGNAVTQVSGKYTFSIKFTDETLSTAGCSPSSPIAYEDIFVQQ